MQACCHLEQRASTCLRTFAGVCRHGLKAPVVTQPLREFGARDLALLCHFQRWTLPTPAVLPPSGKGTIQSLSENFVAGLLTNVPSSVSSMNGTASKLQVGVHCHPLPLMYVVTSRVPAAGFSHSAIQNCRPLHSPSSRAQQQVRCHIMAPASSTAAGSAVYARILCSPMAIHALLRSQCAPAVPIRS